MTTVALAVSVTLFLVWGSTFVKFEPQGNVLPLAGQTMACAAKNGFNLDHAKATYQESRFGRMVPWSDRFVEEIRKGLVACRVMYVSPVVPFLLDPL